MGDGTAEIHIGGDLEPRERLRHITTLPNGYRFFLGASRDGVGVERLKNYEQDLLTSDGTDPYNIAGNGFVPFSVQPKMYLDRDLLDSENSAIFSALIDSVNLLNDALPPEFQISMDGFDTGVVYSGEIILRLETPASISAVCGTKAVACARNNISSILGRTTSSVVYIPDDFDTSDYFHSRSVIVHELLHALGIWGHVDSVEFPDSIMGGSGEYIPNPGHIISRIDREVLQIMYMSQRTDLYNDWGEWSDTSFHLMGRSEDNGVRFGVALFNGLPQPWVTGLAPDTFLKDNSRLYGTATWNGALLGFSGSSPIAGGARLRVGLATLSDPDNEQDLQFRDIYFINKWTEDDKWFPTRNIDYKVNVFSNTFWNVTDDGYEQGLVVGQFLGAEHEHMGGTVKRTDMVAAFGGSR